MHIGIAKENTALLDKVNAALKELGDDGTLKTVTDYFTAAFPRFRRMLRPTQRSSLWLPTLSIPPYESVDGDKIVGIDPTVAGLIADKLGMKLVINDMELTQSFPHSPPARPTSQWPA